MAGCGAETTDELALEEQGQAVTIPPDFDITSLKIFGGMAQMTVAGKAGGTKVPAKSKDIYAYVFFTDRGTYTLQSHDFFDDGGEQNPMADLRNYHGHKITLDASSCITSSTTEGTSNNYGNTVWLVISGSVKTFNKGMTAAFTKNASGVYCVSQVFDTLTK
jgi:hypothetical protein